MATPAISGVVPQERWQPTQNTKVCQYQDCGDEFGFFSTKYNCHRCGIVICKKCAANTTVIPGYYRNTSVPVCPRCFQVIQRFKQRGPSTPGYVVHSNTVSATPMRTSPIPQATPLRTSSPVPKQVDESDLAALQNVIETLQRALSEEQTKSAAATSTSGEEVKTLREENEAMRETLRLLQNQLQQQDQRSGTDAANASELQQRLDAATEKHSALAAEHEALVAEHEATEQQRAELEAQVAQLTSDNAEVREQLSANASELQQRLDAATEKHSALAAEHEALVAEHEALVTEHANVVRKNGELKKSVSGLEEDVEVLMLERDLAVQDRDAAKVQMENAQIAAEKKKLELHAKLESVMEDLLSAQAQVNVALERVNVAETDCASSKATLQARIDELLKEQESSRADLEEVMRHRDAAQQDAEAQHAELRVQVEELLHRQSTLRDELDAARSEIASLTKANELLTSTLEEEKLAGAARIAELEAQLTRLNSDSAAAKAELTQASEKASALMARLTNVYGAVNTRRRSDVSALEAGPDPTSPVAATTATVDARTDNDSRRSAADERGALVVISPSTRAAESTPIAASDPLVDAALIAEVSHRLREREEAMRLLAEGVELRERTRPLERILAEKLAEEHWSSLQGAAQSAGHAGLSESMMDSVVAAAAYHRAGALEARERELHERAAQLKEKERQLLRVAHELQAKSRALQAMHVRSVERAEAAGDDTRGETARLALRDLPTQKESTAAFPTFVDASSRGMVPSQLPPAPVTPPRAVMQTRTSPQDEVDALSPPPRLPAAYLHSAENDITTGVVQAEDASHELAAAGVRHGATTVYLSPSSPAKGQAEEEEATQERLAAATEAYRDVLFEHILETNGLQGCRALVKYLPGPHARNSSESRTAEHAGGVNTRATMTTTGHVQSNSKKQDAAVVVSGHGAGGLSDMARRTRAMLRALEERLDGSRGPLRGVDPVVQQRSLEAFRKLEKAVRALCGASL